MDIERIEIRHASDTVAERVRRWFETTRRVGKLDGSRSVRLPHPDKSGFDLKIKGAGFLGGPIRFGKYLRSGPAAPVFDFDGRMMEDVAAGHNNAFIGGASFQQAATEYAVTQRVAGWGFPVVPCLGYGRLAIPAHDSWFSIFEWDRTWEDAVAALSVSVEDYLEANTHLSRLIIDLAASHDLIGYCSYVRTADGGYRFKDMHAFRQADPISMSQLSWAMQVLFVLNVRCQACLFFPQALKLADLPADLEAYPVRTILPDAKAEDHQHLKSTIVRPYMLRPPAEFSSRALLAALRSNRIASAVLDRCPERYARYEG